MRGDGVNVFMSRVKGPQRGPRDACRAAADRTTKATGATFKSAEIAQTKLGASCRTLHTDRRWRSTATRSPRHVQTMVFSCLRQDRATADLP
jgi:hypothetical protein